MYAMKKVDINDLSFKEKQNALNEIRILASIVNVNIIGYKEAFADEPSAMLWYLNLKFILKMDYN